MKTITVQIGNSDDKLTQKTWSEFVARVNAEIKATQGVQLHFFANSYGAEIWQNSAWVFNIGEKEILDLQFRLEDLAKTYSQDSIAWTEGTTEFIKSKK